MRLLLLLLIFVCVSIFVGCSYSMHDKKDGAPLVPLDVSYISDPVPKFEPKSRYGNPKFYSVKGKHYKVMQSANDYKQIGFASWYGTKFHGRKTSSGERYDMYAMTAAHKSLPLPTYVKVTNLTNGKNITVKVNDRGPFHANRIIDLSYTAALKLDIVQNGTSLVQVEAITPNTYYAKNTRKSKRFNNQIEDIFLQVGAFKEKDRALTLAKQIESMGVAPVHISSSKNSLFKVQVGPLKEQEKISKISDEIASITHDDPLIVTDTL